MLFDLKSDPGETDNLAANPEFADELRRHRRLLKDWQTATNDTALQVELLTEKEIVS